MAVFSKEFAATIPHSDRVLEIGVGQVKRVPHATTLDVNPASVADVIHDLNVFPYPFPDNIFNAVVAEHVLEHLDDVVAVITELHRITKPGGILYIELPYFSSSDFFTDPTHKHAFSTRSFDYFIPDRDAHRFGFRYSDATFKLRRVEMSRYHIPRPMRWFVNPFIRWANRKTWLYESNFAFMIPMQLLNFELEVTKPNIAEKPGDA